MRTRNGGASRRAGFTLAEVMVASGVGLIVVTMTLVALLSISQVYVRSEIKNSVSEDYRDLTRLLAEQGNLSNGFYIFEGFDPSARTLCGVGESGDLVVFVYYGLNSIKADPNQLGVTRIVGFYREKSSNGAKSGAATGAIRWFDSARHDWGHGLSANKPVNLAHDGTGILKLLPVPASATAGNHASVNSVVGNFPVLAMHTMGAASGTGGLRLFYNNDGRSLSVSGFIVRAVSSSGTTVPGYQSQSAFNLTISPRSAN